VVQVDLAKQIWAIVFVRHGGKSKRLLLAMALMKIQRRRGANSFIGLERLALVDKAKQPQLGLTVNDTKALDKWNFPHYSMP
jgi:hypothetical protein